MKSIDLNQIIDDLLSDFTPKQRRVVMGRFGLKNGEQMTLQDIGDELGITRERVRQIEEQASKKLKEKAKLSAVSLFEEAEKHLTAVGGVRRDDYFIQDLLFALHVDGSVKYPAEKLRFLMRVGDNPHFSKEDDKMHAYWYADQEAKAGLLDFIKEVTAFLKTGKRQEVIDKKLYLMHCKDLISCHLVSIPKHFAVNVFGDFGLKIWPEIEPKTIRDKVYLVLKKHEKPLHFEDIAKYIGKFGLAKNTAHVQTVHNELIKDRRFVLVGRGIYGLRENGFEAGTVREVIARLLEAHGPLHSTEVVNLVNQQRFLKENTILLNLQNRRYFKRLEDGRYKIKEA